MTEPLYGSLLAHKLHNDRISVFCPNGHGRQIDVDVLIERFGPDFRIVEERPRFLRAFRCQTCGQRANGLIINPGNTPTIR